MTAPRPTVCVDFDGVLASQGSRAYAADVSGDAVPGAIAWLRSLLTWADVVILTCRALHPGGTEAVRAFLRRNGVEPAALTVTATKPPALVYVDDRALRYEGGAFPTRAEMERRTWEQR